MDLVEQLHHDLSVRCGASRRRGQRAVDRGGGELAQPLVQARRSRPDRCASRSARCRRRRRRGRRGSRAARSRARRGPPRARGSSPSGVPSRASNSSRSIWPACGRNSKIPPPSLLTTTIRTGASAWRSAASAFMSWNRPRSPVTIQVGRPVATAAPIPGRDQAVDPVRAAVGEEERPRRRRPAGTPPGRGSACSRRCRRGRRRRRRCPAPAAGPGSVGSSSALELGGDRRLGGRCGGEPAPRPSRVAAGDRRALRRAPRASGAGLGADDRAGDPGRLVPAVAAGRRRAAPRLGQVREPLAQRLAGRHLAEAQDQVGRQRVGPGAGDRLVGADDQRAVVGAEAKLRGGLGEDRKAASPRRALAIAAAAPGRHPPGDDQAPARGPRAARRARRPARCGRRRGRRRDRGQRPAARGPRAPAPSRR